MKKFTFPDGSKISLSDKKTLNFKTLRIISSMENVENEAKIINAMHEIFVENFSADDVQKIEAQNPEEVAKFFEDFIESFDDDEKKS